MVEKFSLFEPLARGFIDDRTRSSVLLPLGQVAAEVSDLAGRFADSSNRILNIGDQNQARGLNPGIAIGELEVLNGLPEGLEFASDKIYILLRAPADLKPVAGIATVSEGNTVSHVQLLSRNLGIPNAVISLSNLQDLAEHTGARVFYAVSPRGRVVIKPVSQMTREEKALVEDWKSQRGDTVLDTGRADLAFTDLVSLGSLRSTDSGMICGPKAANLGQLSALFPDNVPRGLVVPFGVFRQHFEQVMPGQGITYWEFMKGVLREIELAAASIRRPALRRNLPSSETRSRT